VQLQAVASRERAAAREGEVRVRQLVFEFVAREVARSGLPLEPKVEEELITRMAEAILSVQQAEGGSGNEESRRES
jgi:hypothetical protein